MDRKKADAPRNVRRWCDRTYKPSSVIESNYLSTRTVADTLKPSVEVSAQLTTSVDVASGRVYLAILLPIFR